MMLEKLTEATEATEATTAAAAPKRERKTHNLDPLKPHLTAAEWQLYTCSTAPSVMRRVADTLNNAALRTFKAAEQKLGKMKLGTPREKVLEVLREAYSAHLGKAMRRNAKHGACDTEPEWVAAGLLNKFAAKYGIVVSRWDL